MLMLSVFGPCIHTPQNGSLAVHYLTPLSGHASQLLDSHLFPQEFPECGGQEGDLKRWCADVTVGEWQSYCVFQHGRNQSYVLVM